MLAALVLGAALAADPCLAGPADDPFVTCFDPNNDGHVVLRVISTDTMNDVYAVSSELTGPAASAWLALAGDGTKGYLVSSVSTQAEILGPALGNFVGAFQLSSPGAYPVWDNATARVFIPQLQTNSVSVVDTTSNAVVAMYQTGAQPWAVAIAAGKVYVTNRADGTVTVIGPQRTTTTIASSPRRRKLTSEASMAPVPLAAS